jgi:Zn-dependent M28 family amino/carboxypeptidase
MIDLLLPNEYLLSLIISYLVQKNIIMRNTISYSLILLGMLVGTACEHSGSSSVTDSNVFNKDSLMQHIKILASDSFQGRKPFSAGETKAVDYIQSTFKHLGLEAGNGNSYIQDVPLVEITPTSDPVMKVQTQKGVIELSRSTDFVVSTDNIDSLISLKNDELIFAGYGVVAPEYKWNDYAGIDVKGKVVLVLVNDPGFGTGDTTKFKGNTMTYYGRWTYKFEEAARQGAKACFIIHNTAAASYPFSVVQNSWGSSNLYLDKRGSKDPHLALQGWVSADAAKKLFAAAGKDTSLIMSANENNFKAVSFGEKLSLNVKVKAKYNMSHNVIAKITGTKRPDEVVLYSAHWDHLGIGKADEKGDTIYNGAIDNASGAAALLEIARAYKNLKEKPERTVVFLSVTAEEQGLLGSDYYAKHPIYPLNKTVANINMDGINPLEKTKDIIITGAGQNDLEDYVAEIAKAQSRYLAPEAHPEAGHYYRSDHFSLAKVGVPALDCSGGIDVIGKGKEYGKKLEDDYTANRYHRPADEFDPKWTFDGGMQDMQVLFLVGKKLANETTWPQWKAGSEFKAIRDKK